MFKTKLFTLLLALGAAALPIAANAQNSPPQDAPSYSRPPVASQDETIRGRVLSFDGNYDLQVNDDRGFVDRVQLRQGTIINPTGIRLVPGMAVEIHGVNQGSTFAANQIDTPYTTYGAAYDPYVYPYGVYPYPVYGYPYYGPRFSVGIGFGGFYGRGHFR